MGEPHCIVRARERYGLDISVDELKGLTLRCFKGEGYQPHVKGKYCARGHFLVYGSKVLECLWRPPSGDHNVHGVIVTIVPQATFHRWRGKEDFNQMMRRKGRR